MGYIVRMPKLGLEMKKGTLTEWYVDEGTSVESGAPIAEIESEKTSAEVDAREDGVLRTVYLTEGDDVEPGGPIAIVAGPDEDIADLEAEAGGAAQAEAEATAEPEAEPVAGGDSPAAASTGGAGAASSVKASPRAQKRAEELGVDLTTVEGTGPGGAVTAEDVEAASETGPAAAAEPTAGAATRTVVDRQTFSGMRSTIARRLGESYRDAVHVTIHRTADASALSEATAAVDAALDADVSMIDLLLVALSETLAEYPSFNATYEDGEHVVYDEHNVNVAVDVEEGLVTPVVPGVDEKSLAAVARTRRAVTQRTLAGDYTMDDLSGGTFTVSNLGPLGVEAFDPIINPPQIAILGVDALQERVAIEDGDFVARTVLPLDLSFDHRVVDGADAARFVGTLVDHLENPWPLVVGAGEDSAAVSVEAGESPQTTFEDAERRVVTNNEEESLGTFTIDDHDYEFGLETAPTPPEIFLGSLESCLALTLRNVALEMEIEIDAVHVDGALRPESGAVEKIEMAVSVDAPDATDEALENLLEEAEAQCHVAVLLREDLPVSISLERP
jgi:pyruvate dehydrogenase E2 component (dihydrolipoamide acetyltransferase)